MLPHWKAGGGETLRSLSLELFGTFCQFVRRIYEQAQKPLLGLSEVAIHRSNSASSVTVAFWKPGSKYKESTIQWKTVLPSSIIASALQCSAKWSEAEEVFSNCWWTLPWTDYWHFQLNCLILPMEGKCGCEEVAMRVKMRGPRAYEYVTILADGGESQPLPTWKTYCKYHYLLPPICILHYLFLMLDIT